MLQAKRWERTPSIVQSSPAPGWARGGGGGGISKTRWEREDIVKGRIVVIYIKINICSISQLKLSTEQHHGVRDHQTPPCYHGPKHLSTSSSHLPTGNTDLMGEIWMTSPSLYCGGRQLNNEKKSLYMKRKFSQATHE